MNRQRENNIMIEYLENGEESSKLDSEERRVKATDKLLLSNILRSPCTLNHVLRILSFIHRGVMQDSFKIRDIPIPFVIRSKTQLVSWTIDLKGEKLKVEKTSLKVGTIVHKTGVESTI